MTTEFNPKIVAFVCNWCSYAGADKAGGQRLDYAHNVELIRVMCSGRVTPSFVMEAFEKGADGVMVLGCHPGDCHYRTGNYKAKRRFTLFQKMLSQFGVDPRRFKLDWVAAGEGAKFQKVSNEITEEVKKLGPLKLTGFVKERGNDL
ncbi:MAG: hypothetical protein A2504_11085 [Bdellovibrionales bacterium RIFOXYD12_FULL_39_22]|nr:MAG: hypothetical protein A2385_09650 [Bdellovibrionales bacterium RIFOXYB1_FULL_39_21]OFZ44220.1 MAG: hypothetical protein A2485_07270 [Bdellovibrionales bacterium RIFOXYC12_FULL_39_17]OFZ46762.1 MAG: hypothetical protein A2404_04505 [Bdellovibrionales bacterium RIFOXYC1_FULL_39_130]OFZ75961.1 MAG: hypothetical protein A2560_02645 [Bdellovibrionales bacterium RIFOXYD1_FULL_39_84]OFZ95441.1 MAG: hypothetical protein A2504_11085 [Bdellovibrionales bacterium RIFOXYD12_FULL_39_22]HLE09826.1 hy